MDIRDLMAYAPADCQPTVVSRDSLLEEWAKKHHKTVEELTDEEVAAYRAEQSKYAAALDDPLDAYRD
jgi:hypothetical protein